MKNSNEHIGNDANHVPTINDGGHIKYTQPTALAQTDRPLSSPTRHTQYADHSLQESEVEAFAKAERKRSIHIAPVAGVPEPSAGSEETV